MAALLTTCSLKAAAEAAGVDGKTLRAWLRDDPEFSAAYRAARSRMVNDAVDELVAAQSEAVSALRRCLTSESDTARISAARSILEYSIRGRELTDLEQRIATLERRRQV